MIDSSVETTVSASDTEMLLSEIQNKAAQIREEIAEQYLEDSIPWVVGFSGGKDSTAVLQLIFEALSQLSPSERQKEIHVLSNDTLVENPNVVKFLDDQLYHIEEAGKTNLFSHAPNLFQVFKSTPKLEDTFWLNRNVLRTLLIKTYFVSEIQGRLN